MKKRTAILCALMLSVSMLSACGNNSDQTAQDTENVGDTTGDQTEDAEQEEVPDDGMTEAYEGLVDDYRSLVEEQWDYDQIYEHNYSDLATMVSVGYTLYDLDQDGQMELLFGETDTEEPVNRMILDAYTMDGDAAKQLFTSQERNRYYLVEDEAGAAIIANEGSNGAASSGWLYYTVENGELSIQQSVIYDAGADEQNPWFTSVDDDWDVSNDTPTDEETAQAVIDSYTEQYAVLDWTPLADAIGTPATVDSNVTKLEANSPVEIDGQEFTLVTSDPKENDDMISVTAQYGSNSFELDAETLAVGDIYALKLNGQYYVLAETRTYNDYATTYLVKLDGEKFAVSQQDGSIEKVPSNPADGIEVTSKVDVLGTYGGTRTYHIVDDKLTPDGDTYLFNHASDVKLNVKGSVSCRLEGSNATLNAGDVITPTSYSEDGTFGFELEDGTAGSLTVDFDADGFYAGTIGGVSENDLFEELPYAG